MEAVAFDALTRRASLVSAGTAGLAALAIPIAAKGKKRKKRKTKGDVFKLCKAQEADCAFVVESECQGDTQCLIQGLQCCEFLATCDIAGFLACLVAIGEE
jgi:hypothetical protein